MLGKVSSSKMVDCQAAIPIISRTSSGPCAYLFDPAKLGESPAPATPVVRYPLETPLAKVNSTNPLFNMCTSIRGLVFPKPIR